MTLLKIAAVLVPFVSLFTVHILGFTANSDFALLGLLTTGMLSGLMWAFFASIVFSVLMARLVVYLGRGYFLRILAIVVLKLGFLEQFRRNLRVLTVILVRKPVSNIVLVSVVSIVIFNMIYLGTGFFLALFVCIIPIGVMAFYASSEEGLLIASSFLRGKDRSRLYFHFKGFFPRETPSEKSVARLLEKKLIGSATRIVFLVLLVCTHSSYLFGKMRETHLRSENYYSWAGVSELSYIAGDGQNLVFWSEKTKEYIVVSAESSKELRISIPSETE